jgi:hypothetical protein
MAGTTYIHENIFIDELKDRLSKELGWKVEKETENSLVDLVIETQTGKRMFIEFKQAGRYGELPLSTVLSLSRQKNRLSGNDILCLVSFSSIPSILEDKLTELGILAIEKPSVEDAAGRIEQVMMAEG